MPVLDRILIPKSDRPDPEATNQCQTALRRASEESVRIVLYYDVTQHLLNIRGRNAIAEPPRFLSGTSAAFRPDMQFVAAFLFI